MTPGILDVIADARATVGALGSGEIVQPLIGAADVSPELVSASQQAIPAAPIAVEPIDQAPASAPLELPAPVPGPAGPAGPQGPGISREEFQQVLDQIAQLQEFALLGIL